MSTSIDCRYSASKHAAELKAENETLKARIAELEAQVAAKEKRYEY